MPRYFFHIHNDVIHSDDEQGQEMNDVEEARKGAMKGIREILASEIVERGQLDLRGHILVTDENQNEVFVVRYAEAIEIIK